MAQIVNNSITLPVSDSSMMNAYVAQPDGAGPYPGMMVFQEAFGVNAHIRDVTDRFARSGFVAVAPELYHRVAPGFEGAYEDLQAAIQHASTITGPGLAADLQVTFDWLQANSLVQSDRIACVGFCMGGYVAYLANASLPLQAAISFYGGRIAANLDRAAEQHGPLLLFWGGLDKHIGPDPPRAVADALTKSGKNYVNVEFAQADHGFFCDARDSFNQPATGQAQALMTAFLDSYVSGSQPLD